jgi:hypothetical protein
MHLRTVPPRPAPTPAVGLGDARMADRSSEKRLVEFVNLLRKQVEALELETYVGLTDAEQREYDKRQERIRDLEAKMRASRTAAA